MKVLMDSPFWVWLLCMVVALVWIHNDESTKQKDVAPCSEYREVMENVCGTVKSEVCITTQKDYVVCMSKHRDLNKPRQ